MRKGLRYFFLSWLFLTGCSWPVFAQEAKVLSIEEFIQLTTQNDTVFDEILIDQLRLKYRKDLRLPARDIVLSVKAQYDFFLDQDREEPEVGVALSKLFPYTGTGVALSYENVPSFGSTTSGSELEFLISQPIAENAFGRSTRLLDKIVGIEIDVIRYQIVEAYEDYLASLMAVYYDWYSAYENLKIGEVSHRENQKLLDNIHERQRQKIALSIDVNKVKLLVIGKEENLISLQEAYKNLTNVVAKAVRYDGPVPLVPSDPSAYSMGDLEFEKDYQEFTGTSRTYEILGLLEKGTSLEVKRSADDLLPSTNLLLGYRVSGEEWDVRNEDNLFFAGISFDWPFPDQVERAEYEISKIQHRQTKLSNQNKYLQLYTDLRNLYLQFERETALLKIADDKIELAEAVLKDEAENYSLGRVSLNDYIDAVNRVDENKFNKISRVVQLKKLIVEWLRLTDKLVGEKVLGELDAK
jgi:outer membrane protein TolC